MSPTPASMAVPTQPTAYAWEATDEQVAERYGVPAGADRPLRPQHLPAAAGPRPPPAARAATTGARSRSTRRPTTGSWSRPPPLATASRPTSCWWAPAPTRSWTSSPRRSSRPARSAVDPDPDLRDVPRPDRAARRPAASSCPRRPAADGYALDIPATRAAARDASLVWLCSPNNPTGLAGARRRDRRAARRPAGRRRRPPAAGRRSSSSTRPTPSSSGGRSSALREAYPRLVVVRTASKAYALAGLRVGFAIARRELLAEVEPYRPPGLGGRSRRWRS